MSRLELIATTAGFLAIVVVATAFGGFVLAQLRRALRISSAGEETLAERVGAGLMVGLGALGWVATWVGLAGMFSRWLLLAMVLAAAALSARELRSLAVETGARARTWWAARATDPVVALVLLSGAVFALILFLAALQPPYSSDELHYHFPQAEILVRTGRLTLPLGGHPYYGNIPKLMEVIFAFGIALGGYSFAHTLHLAFVFGFVVFAAGFVTRHEGARAGCIAALGLLVYREYTWNGTVGFVDAATASLEVSALLLALDWLLHRRDAALVSSATLLGFAVGMKYSPLPTVLFIVVAMAGVALARRPAITRSALAYAGIAAVFGGFWYLRNLVLFANPVYPFYFGHAGMSDEAYRAILADLRQFGPRTLRHFLGTPWRIWLQGDMVPALAIVVSPVAVSGRRARPLHAALLAYVVGYALYWFFAATHQTRFLMPAILVSLILASVVVTRFIWAFVTLIVLAMLAGQLRAHRGEVAYALGLRSRSEFLSRNFGCQYDAIAYLEQHRLTGTVIDNWSIWHAPSVSFYARSNEFMRYSVPLQDGRAALDSSVRRANIRYVFVDTAVKARHLANPDPDVARGRDERAAVEQVLLQSADPIFVSGSCRLYRIDWARLGAPGAPGAPAHR